MRPIAGACWLRHNGYVTDDCDGPYDKAHLIPAQRMRISGLDELAIGSSMVWRLCCRKHHHQLDLGKLKLERDQYPDTVEEWAREHGFWWNEARQEWRAGASTVLPMVGEDGT